MHTIRYIALHHTSILLHYITSHHVTLCYIYTIYHYIHLYTTLHTSLRYIQIMPLQDITLHYITSSTRTKRGESCLRVLYLYTIRPFSSIELVLCANQARACVLCANLLHCFCQWSLVMTRRDSRCNATPSDTLRSQGRTSHFTLHSSRSGILPNTSPMQHSCSLYNAICNRTLQNTIEEPITGQNDPSRNRVTQELPFIAGCSHFTRKNPPQHKSLFCYVSCYVCIVIAIPVTQIFVRNSEGCFPTSFDYITNITNYNIRFFNTQLLSHMHTLQHCHTAYIINYYVTFLPFYITIHYLLTYIYYI